MVDVVAISGGDVGPWRVLSMGAVRGDELPPVRRIAVDHLSATAGGAAALGAAWTLRGAVSHLRYATAVEVAALRAIQAPLGRPGARRAALIPIQKSAAWWAFAQDERRALLEEYSHHTAVGMTFLPAIARQLYHCRDLGEPFDFLTWFDYAPEQADVFEDLVQRMRGAPEWAYVSREVDIRLERDP